MQDRIERWKAHPGYFLAPIIIVLALAAVLALAGCGNERNDYVRAVNAAQDKYGGEIAKRSVPTPTDATFDSQADSVQALAVKVNSMEAPKGMTGAQSAFAAALRQAEQAIRSKQDLLLPMARVRAAIASLNGDLASSYVPTFAVSIPFAGRSSFSSSSKSYSGGGGSKSSSSRSSSSSKSYSSSKPRTASASKPSTGSKSQPAPVRKLVPPRPSPRVQTFLQSAPGTRRTVDAFGVRGRNYSQDAAFIRRNPSYADPYFFGGGSRIYYGYSQSPLFYLWLGSVMDGDRTYPRPPESEDKVSEAIVSYLGVIQAEQKIAGGAS